jgi:hypothetical protein
VRRAGLIVDNLDGLGSERDEIGTPHPAESRRAQRHLRVGAWIQRASNAGALAVTIPRFGRCSGRWCVSGRPELASRQHRLYSLTHLRNTSPQRSLEWAGTLGRAGVVPEGGEPIVEEVRDH